MCICDSFTMYCSVETAYCKHYSYYTILPRGVRMGGWGQIGAELCNGICM